MALVITPKFNQNQIRKALTDKKQRILNAILFNLNKIGTDFTTAARSIDTYKDHTSNLRSSIGYVIYYNGEQVSGKFPGDKQAGVSKGTELADNIAKEYDKGFVLVCVAGMEYASFVEAKGFDVITNSSLAAIIELQDAMKKLKQKINRMQ